MSNKGSQLNVNTTPHAPKKVMENNNNIDNQDLHTKTQRTKEKEKTKTIRR